MDADQAMMGDEAEANDSPQEDSQEGQTATVDSSFFNGKTPTVGQKESVEVVSVDGDSITIKCSTSNYSKSGSSAISQAAAAFKTD